MRSRVAWGAGSHCTRTDLSAGEDTADLQDESCRGQLPDVAYAASTPYLFDDLRDHSRRIALSSVVVRAESPDRIGGGLRGMAAPEPPDVDQGAKRGSRGDSAVPGYGDHPRRWTAPTFDRCPAPQPKSEMPSKHFRAHALVLQR